MHRLLAGNISFSIKDLSIHRFFLSMREGRGVLEPAPCGFGRMTVFTFFSKYDFMIELYSSEAVV